jgi:CarboxypepD_reg-like domain/Secretion system C-terminal sorting domain
MKKGLFTLTLLCSIIVALSAQKTVTGAVLDEKGEPLPFTAITIKGAKMGALTDFDGLFSLRAKETDTLVFTFLGYKSQEQVVDKFEKINVNLVVEETMIQCVEVVGYGVISCCRCCGGSQEKSELSINECYFQCGMRSLCIVNDDNLNQKIEKQLKVSPISKGATKLNYSIENSWFGSTNRNISAFKNKYIKYQISKSTDDVNYKIIGTSQSDTTLYVEEKTGKTLVAWGGSQFLDKERNKAELTYYLVEGYLEDFVEKEDEKDENTEGVEPKERILVYSKKISVEGSDYLNINTLFNESNQIALNISSPLNEVANFRIVDMAGRVLTSHQQSLLKENNTLTLAHNDLPAGMYILHVQQGEQTDSRKFTITK